MAGNNNHNNDGKVAPPGDGAVPAALVHEILQTFKTLHQDQQELCTRLLMELQKMRELLAETSEKRATK